MKHLIALPLLTLLIAAAPATKPGQAKPYEVKLRDDAPEWARRIVKEHVEWRERAMKTLPVELKKADDHLKQVKRKAPGGPAERSAKENADKARADLERARDPKALPDPFQFPGDDAAGPAIYPLKIERIISETEALVTVDFPRSDLRMIWISDPAVKGKAEGERLVLPVVRVGTKTEAGTDRVLPHYEAPDIGKWVKK